MKKSNVYIILASLIFMSSCATLDNNLVTSEFTTTSKIYRLNVGMSEQAVINGLAVQPYEISYDLNSVEKVLIWNYKKPHHEVRTSKANSEMALSPQTPLFKEEGVLYVYFKDGMMSNYYTDSGKKESTNLIRMNQQLNN